MSPGQGNKMRDRLPMKRNKEEKMAETGHAIIFDAKRSKIEIAVILKAKNESIQRDKKEMK
jgi:hypothetical protein